MSEKKKIWVRSRKKDKDGNYAPLFLNDSNYGFELNIDIRMAKEEIPVHVVDCMLVQSFVKRDELEELTPNYAKPIYKKFMAQVNRENREKAAEVANSIRIETEATAAAEKAYKEKIEELTVKEKE